MKRHLGTYNRISSLFFLGLGTFFACYGRTVDVGAWNEPGPGFLPFWSGVTLALMSFALFLGTFRHRPWPAMPRFFAREDSWKRVLMAFLSLIAYLLLFQVLGFPLTTFLFVAFLVRFVFPQSWKRTLLAAFFTAGGAWLLFVYFLETQLPKGLLGF